ERTDLLEAARGGDGAAFEQLIAPYRGELEAHCYRMLGSVHDAEDAMQDALLRAWRGIARFEGRSSVRSWLYRIATNSSLRLIQQATLRSLGDHALRELVDRFVAAWERGDVDAIRAMLTEEAVLTMPPWPTWFSGRDAVADFLAHRPLHSRHRWRLQPTRAS